MPQTTPMVLKSRTMSCQRLQLRTYQESSWRRPLKLMSLRPLTCQRPVMPGVVMQMTGRKLPIFSFSRGRYGRGPTRLISPLMTLKICGSSSRLYLRMNLPTFVTRGSSPRSFWNSFHSCSALGCLPRKSKRILSAFWYIERNL